MFSRILGRKNVDVLVVGAGPVGLFTALQLARRGVDVSVVDREWRPAAHGYALALHPATLRLLEPTGVLTPILEQAYRVRTIGLFDGTSLKAKLNISELKEDFSFVAVMRQSKLERLLVQALEELGVKVMWTHQVATLRPVADGVEATVDSLVKESVGYSVAHMEWIVAKSADVTVPFVVGADGHRSLVRRALNIPYEVVGPAQHFAVFEFKTDWDHDGEMRVVMDNDTTNVLWPLTDGYCRWSFELQDYEATMASRIKDRLLMQVGTTQYPLLSEDDLREFIRSRAPWFEGSIDEIAWRLVVRFEKRRAPSFGRDRMWLVGDAGHMTGPVGIQSMNIGLREGDNLAEAIATFLKGSGANRLVAYSEERLREWNFLLGVTGGLAPTSGVDPWLAARADRLLPSIPASGSDLDSLCRQLGFETSMGSASSSTS